MPKIDIAAAPTKHGTGYPPDADTCEHPGIDMAMDATGDVVHRDGAVYGARSISR